MLVSNPTADALLCGLLLTTLGMVWVVALVRVNGLRSFSKMTSFDFVMTVAVGSTLAGMGQATDGPAVIQAASVMAGLFAVQFLTAWARRHSDAFARLIGNTPVLLMRDGVIDDAALRRVRVTRGDLISKLREANALQRSDIRAVVLETTGDVSVLHGAALDDLLLSGVDAPRG